MNQCDGCRQGYPIVMGIHRTLDNEPYMCCTKDKYDISENDIQVLENIYRGAGILNKRENQTRLRLQAKGYCVMTTNDGLVSFNTGESAVYWDLTSKGCNLVEGGLQ